MVWLGVEPKEPRPPSASPGVHGVTAEAKRRKAQICYGGKTHRIGSFDTEQEEAALAYDEAAREQGAGKKKLNFESIEALEEAAAHTCTS
jgi:hypothetical protein